MSLSEIFDEAMWKTNLSMPCNAVQYALSRLKRGEQWDDKMQEQIEKAKYVLQIMIVIAEVSLLQGLTPDETELFGQKWAAARNILQVLGDAEIMPENLLAKSTETLRLIDELLDQHKLPISQYDWLKKFFHWLGEPFLLSAHADLAAQRETAPI